MRRAVKPTAWPSCTISSTGRSFAPWSMLSSFAASAPSGVRDTFSARRSLTPCMVSVPSQVPSTDCCAEAADVRERTIAIAPAAIFLIVLLLFLAEEFLDAHRKDAGDPKRERQAGVVPSGFDCVHGLPRYLEPLGEIRLCPSAFGAQFPQTVFHQHLRAGGQRAVRQREASPNAASAVAPIALTVVSGVSSRAEAE